MSCWAIIAAAGSGSRMGGGQVKTLLPLAGRPVIAHSVERLSALCDGVILVARQEDVDAFEQALRQGGLRADRILPGGSTRQQSVLIGLQALPPECDLVLVHDGARPLASEPLIRRVIDSARRHGSGVPALAVTDTVKRLNADGHSVDTLNRDLLRTVQTPQGFQRALLERAYRKGGADATDDASLVERLGVPVHLVEGEASNLKITFPGDVERAEALLLGSPVPRVGLGYDAHRLVAGRPLVLGGVAIPFEKGLSGHSDADAASHALMDALLGAAALGDIGQHFPDTDPKYAGISSLKLLCHVVDLLHNQGLAPYNVDITIAAQAPKLAPHVPRMREVLANALSVPLDRVSVKATTTEGMGFEGSGEGISARAVALVRPAK